MRKRGIIYCRVPASQALQVTVAWGHGWRAPKHAGTAHWLKPPTYSATKNTPNRILVLTLEIFLPLVSPTKCNSTFCRVPPSQGLQVTVAWGHGWRTPKRAGTAHWLKPPTYWATLNTTVWYRRLQNTYTMLRAIKLQTNNTKYTLVHNDYYSKTTGVGRNNIIHYTYDILFMYSCITWL